MFVCMRAVTYISLFIGFFLIYFPRPLIRGFGGKASPRFGVPQLAGAVLIMLGGALALWWTLSIATHGRGTPAPFNPPRDLVILGPYRYVRNPMYLAAIAALLDAALIYAGSPDQCCA